MSEKEKDVPIVTSLDLEAGGGGVDDEISPPILEYSPRMDDFDRQLNRMMSAVAHDEEDGSLMDDPHSTKEAPSAIESKLSSEDSTISHKPSRDSKEENSVEGSKKGYLDDTDAIDFEIWESTDVPPPPSLGDMPTLDEFQTNDIESGGKKDVNTADSEEGAEEHKRGNSLLTSLLPEYGQKFQREADPMKMVISKIPEDIVKAQQAELENVTAKRRQDILNATKRRERGLLQREHLARARLEQMEADSLERVRREQEKKRLEDREKEVDMAVQFRQAREEMESHLQKKDAQLREAFGEVSVDQSMGRRFKVEWDLSPQPVEMRVHCLRACKNKLPKGAYVLMLSQRDRLGGAPIVWSRIGAYGIGEDHPATTRPVKHYGRYFDRTMKVEDSVYALCPPKNQIKPSNVFVLELFQLAGRSNPIDKVVAWTALPMSNTHFTVVSGKYRLPMLRGEPTPSIQHFNTMESLMAEDLSAWLCNIYVEIRHIPRTMALEGMEGMEDAKTEYEIEFDFMSKLLNLGERVSAVGGGSSKGTGDDKKRASDQSSGEDEDFRRHSVVKSGGEVDLGLFQRSLYPRRRRGGNKIKKSSSKNASNTASGTAVDPIHMLNAHGGGGASGWWTTQNKVVPVGGDLDEEEGSSKPLLALAKKTEDRMAFKSKLLGSSSEESSEDSEGEGENKRVPRDILERGYDRGDEFFLHEHQRGKLAGIETLPTANDRQWAASSIESNGTVVRKLAGDGIRLDSDAIRGKRVQKVASPRGADSWTAPLVEQKDFDQYSMSLTPDIAQQRRILPDALVKSKLRYLYYEALGDILPGHWGTFDSYIAITVFVMAFWLRMYLHYIGQYFFLQAFRTPVYAFDLRLYEIVFKYMSSSVPVSVEFGVVVVGPLGCVFVLFCMSFLASFFYRYAKVLPDTVSQFVAAFGIATVLDPVLIFLVDIIMHNYSCGNVDEDCQKDYTSRACDCFVGDFMKLWNRMEREENSGLTGLMITLMVYTGTSIMALLILYEYLINSHKQARILDIWRRVSGPAEEFFIPHDFEVSYAELSSIMTRAKIWRGAQGSTRKVVVSEYEEKDPYDVEFVAVTKHYAIYEHEMDGKRTLHRHFLMLPDGAIIEIFDQLSLDLTNQFKSLERLLGDTKKPGSSSSIPKNRKQNSSIFAGLDNA